jgi:hypothetical protein
MSLVLANGQVVNQAYIRQWGSVSIFERPLNFPETFEFHIERLFLHLLPEDINRLAPVVRKALRVDIDRIKDVDYSTVVRELTEDRYVFTRQVDGREVAPRVTYNKRQLDYASVSSDHLVIPTFPWPVNEIVYELSGTFEEEYEGLDLIGRIQRFMDHMKQFNQYTLMFNSRMFKKLVWKDRRFSVYFKYGITGKPGEVSQLLQDSASYIYAATWVLSPVQTPVYIIQLRGERHVLEPNGRWILGERGADPLPGMRIPIGDLSVIDVRRIQELLLLLASVRAIPRLSNGSPMRLLTSDLVRRMSDYFT